jgi:hypothetical protein
MYPFFIRYLFVIFCRSGCILPDGPQVLSSRARISTGDVDVIVFFFDSIYVGRVSSHKAGEWLFPVTVDIFNAQHVRPATDGAEVHVLGQRTSDQRVRRRVAPCMPLGG